MRKFSIWLLCLMLLSAMIFGAVAVMAEETAPVAQNAATGETYEDLTAALGSLQEGQTLKLLQDAEATIVLVQENTTLDLNGHTLKALYVSGFGYIVDGSTENTGTLQVDEQKLLINESNTQLPVKTDAGFRFVEIIGFNTTWMNSSTFVFQPLFEASANELLKSGAAATGVSIQVEVTWRPFEGSEDLDSRTFKYGDTLVTKYIGSYKPESGKYGQMFTLTLVDPENYVDLQCNTKVVSATGVQFVPSPAAPEVKQEIQLTTEQASAIVAEGTKLEKEGVELILNTVEVETTTVVAGEGEDARSMDIHVAGIAADNTVAVIVTVNGLAPEFMNRGNITLYHIENGEAVEMTRVYTVEEVDAHNEYYYDIETGTVTMAVTSFSAFTSLYSTENAWNGNRDYSWYDADAKELKIANADQLAGFGAIVGGMDGQTRDNFAGKTVKLIADINIGDLEDNAIVLYPVGYYNSDGTYEKTGTAITSGMRPFEGTFDGTGHTIANFYQNTWEMKGDHDWYDATLQYYRDGMGLFGRVYGGTVKNLTVRNFSSDGEICTTGTIAAYADHGATFENIAIFDCNPRVYNIGNGGIVGCVGWYNKAVTDQKVTFKNITVDNTNKISALWGSWDVPCGGLVGQYYPTSGQSSANYPVNAGIHMENCHVAAQIDVNNDVCANYQYYAYRYAGILIGSVRENETINGREYPKMDGITASGCTVHFGDWNDYYYCELVDNSTASYTHDYQMSRLVEIKAIDGTTVTYLDGTTGTVPASGRANYVIVDYTKGHGTENATCYHFKDGAVWTHDMGGYETTDIDGDGEIDSDVLKEDKQHLYLEFNNLVTGYGWGVTSKGVEDMEGVEILDRKTPDSVVKFESKGVTQIPVGTPIPVGDLFKALSNPAVPIRSESVQVSVSAPNGVVTGTFNAKSDWTKSTITFEGTGNCQVTIQDYDYCEPLTIEVTTNIETKSDVYCEACGKNVTWIKWDGESRFLDGHYYVGESITINTLGKIYGGKKVCLDLCGNNLTGTTDLVRFFDVSGTFNLMDSADVDGTITSEFAYAGTESDKVGNVMYIYEYGNVTVWGGNLVADGTYYRGAVFMVNSGKLTVRGGTITLNSKTQYGGIMRLVNSAEVTITGGTFKATASATNGSVAYARNSAKLNITGGTLLGNNSTGIGGTICVEENAVVSVSGGTISGGSSDTKGGNIGVLGNAVLKLSGGTITDGTAKAAPNVFIGDTAKLELSGKVQVDGVVVGGTMTENGLSTESSISFIAVKLGTFLTCTDVARAQALKDCFISESSGCYIAQVDNTLTFNATVLSHCLCGGQAAGVGDHSECTSEDWLPISWALAGASASADRADFTSLASGSYYLDCDLTMVSGAKVGQREKGIYIKLCLNGHDIRAGGGSRTLGYISVGCQLDICDCKYDAETHAGGTVYGAQGVHGSIVYIRESGKLRVFGGNLTNYSEDYVATGYGLITVAMDDVENVIDYNAPASEFRLYNGRVYGGRAASGGNLSLLHSAKAYIYGGSIEGGMAENVNEASVYNRTVMGCGGNIYAGNRSTVEISGGKIFDGYAKGNPVVIMTDSQTRPLNYNLPYMGSGGNIYCEGTLTVSGGEIYDGKANGNSGGNINFLSHSTVFTLTGGEIRGGEINVDGSTETGVGGNLAYSYDVSGGSVHITAITGYAKFNMSGGTISGGKAGIGKAGEGGNLCIRSVEASLTGGMIVGGQAAKGGNVMAFSNPKLDGVTIKDGYASHQGGNIALFNCKNATITGSTVITGGKAGVSGGNILIDSNEGYENGYKLVISGGTITGGVATSGYGGNIYCGYNEKTVNAVEFTGGTISGGKAAGADNNIYTANNTYLLLDGVIVDHIYTSAEGQLKLSKKVTLTDVVSDGMIYTLEDFDTASSVTFDKTNTDTAVTVVTAVSNTQAANVKDCFTPAKKGMALTVVDNTLVLDWVHKSHCVCGDSAVHVEDHVCADIEWQPLEGCTDLASLPSGNYYLLEDLYITNANEISIGKQLRICLNGYDIIATGEAKSVFGSLRAGASVEVCDCSGVQAADGSWTWQGDIRADRKSNSVNYGGVANIRAYATMTVYGGNFYGPNEGQCIAGGIFNVCNDGVASANTYLGLTGDAAIKKQDDTRLNRNTTWLKIYNGNFVGGQMYMEQLYSTTTTDGVTTQTPLSSYQGAVINTWHDVGVYVYGGTIRGGNTKRGGAICVTGSGELVLKNCTVYGGTVSGKIPEPNGTAYPATGCLFVSQHFTFAMQNVTFVIPADASSAGYMVLNGTTVVGIYATEEAANAKLVEGAVVIKLEGTVA